MKKTLLFVVFVSLVAFPACKGEKRAEPPPIPPQSEPPPIPPQKEIVIGSLSEPISILTSEDQLAVLSEIPETGLTITDRMRRDFLNGTLPRKEYLKQKLCWVYGRDCLAPQYQVTDAPPESCGTSFFPKLVHEILTTEPAEEALDVVTFWEELLEESESGPAPSSLLELLIPVPEAWAQIIAPTAAIREGLTRIFAMTRVGTPEFCFQIVADDTNLRVYTKLEKKEPFEVDGRLFEIFFAERHRPKAQMIIDSFTRGRLPSRGGPFGQRDPIAFDHDDPYCNPQQAYRLFILPEAVSKYRNYTTMKMGDPSSYITLTADDIDQCWASHFLRDGRGCASEASRLADSLAAHEWTHALEWAENPLVAGETEPAAEAIADVGNEYFFESGDGEIHHLSEHLYRMEHPLFEEDGAKEYGSSLFFWCLTDRADSMEPVTRYIQAMKQDQGVSAALEAAASVTPEGTFRRAWHRCTEKSANLVGVPGDYPRFVSKHPSYLDVYLAGAISLPLPDYSEGMLPGFHNKMTVEMKNLLPRSSAYRLLLTLTGNQTNHLLFIDGSDCSAKGVDLSAFGIKVENDDPSRYRVVIYEDLSGRGEGKGWCFKETEGIDSEPDILLLAFSNGSHTEKVGCEVVIEARPFCESFPFTAAWSYRDPENRNHTEQVSLQGELDFLPALVTPPQLTTPFGPRTVVKSYTLPSPEEFQRLPAAEGFKGLTRAHGTNVTLSWRMRETTRERAGLSCIRAIERRAEGSRALGPDEFVGLSFSGGVSVEPDQLIGEYKLLTLLVETAAPVSVRQSCSGLCPPGTCTEASWTDEDPWGLPALTDLIARYSDGQRVLTEADPHDGLPGEDLTWNFVLPEPMEVNSPQTLMRLRFFFLTDDPKLSGQLLAPIVDFQRTNLLTFSPLTFSP